MNTKTLKISAALGVLLVAGCAYGPPPPPPGPGPGPVAYYDGYYDDGYGPFYDGYWGDDGFFYYSDAGHNWHRDDHHHFSRTAAAGFHPVHGSGVRREH